jgi:hypothetical protein
MNGDSKWSLLSILRSLDAKREVEEVNVNVRLTVSSVPIEVGGRP